MLDVPPARTGARPGSADAADLVAERPAPPARAGPRSSGLDAGLVIAAPVALALAAGISAFAWWRVEPVCAGAYMGGSALLGRFRTLGPIAYAAWLLAALARAVLPARARPGADRRGDRGHRCRRAAGAPLITPVDRPPLWVLMALAVFGGLALAGTERRSGAGVVDVDATSDWP